MVIPPEILPPVILAILAVPEALEINVNALFVLNVPSVNVNVPVRLNAPDVILTPLLVLLIVRLLKVVPLPEIDWDDEPVNSISPVPSNVPLIVKLLFTVSLLPAAFNVPLAVIVMLFMVVSAVRETTCCTETLFMLLGETPPSQVEPAFQSPVRVDTIVIASLPVRSPNDVRLSPDNVFVDAFVGLY